MLQGNAITVTEDIITLYDNHESVELFVADRELGQQLKDTLLNWLTDDME